MKLCKKCIALCLMLVFLISVPFCVCAQSEYDTLAAGIWKIAQTYIFETGEFLEMDPDEQMLILADDGSAVVTVRETPYPGNWKYETSDKLGHQFVLEFYMGDTPQRVLLILPLLPGYEESLFMLLGDFGLSVFRKSSLPFLDF